MYDAILNRSQADKPFQTLRVSQAYQDNDIKIKRYSFKNQSGSGELPEQLRKQAICCRHLAIARQGARCQDLNYVQMRALHDMAKPEAWVRVYTYSM
jgi:hypothetical protein